MQRALWPYHLKVVMIGDSGSAVYRKVSSGWKHRSIQHEVNNEWMMYGNELVWKTCHGATPLTLAAEIAKVGSIY